MLGMMGQILRNFALGPVTRVKARQAFAGSRGQLNFSAENCIYCGLCERRCPADAIHVDRLTHSWNLNPLRCIVCGECVTACKPKCLCIAPEWMKSAASHEIVPLGAPRQESPIAPANSHA